LKALATQAEESGAHNVAFTCKWLLGDTAGCVEVLTKTNRLAEAVLFSQTYKPSLTVDTVKAWKESLEKNKKGRVAKVIAVPTEDEELFPEWEEWLRLESEGGVATGEENGEAEEAQAEEAEAEDAESEAESEE
ncbi:hypothetical protein PC116_g31538, partial [Phytophthora cactorum]